MLQDPTTEKLPFELSVQRFTYFHSRYVVRPCHDGTLENLHLISLRVTPGLHSSLSHGTIHSKHDQECFPFGIH